jgi:hypothetical protein
MGDETVAERIRKLTLAVGPAEAARTIRAASGLTSEEVAAQRPLFRKNESLEVRRASFDAPAAEGRPARLVVNPRQTACLDGSGGAGLRLVFEVRDDEERLVAAAGDVTVTVFDASDAAPVARWEIPAAHAAGHFRRTSRNRGLHFEFPWQGRFPAGETVRVVVGFAPAGGQPLETEATIRTR